MRLHFYIHYNTAYGESIRINYADKDDIAGQRSGKLNMEFLEDGYWHAQIDSTDITHRSSFMYNYSLLKNGNEIENLDIVHVVPLIKQKVKTLIIVDEWKSVELFTDIFSTRPFTKLIQRKTKELKRTIGKNQTHSFFVKCMPLADPIVPCILGSSPKMGQWDEKKAVLLHRYEEGWMAKFNLHKEKFPIEYKVGLFDTREKKMLFYEPGPNRILTSDTLNDLAFLYQLQPAFEDFAWKGAGVNFPVSALKTHTSWGIGDFTDLIPMIDWAKSVGLKLLQLLPVNDTTATHTRKDSYPYSAISAFGLHPAYLNVAKLATAYSVPIEPETQKEIDQLNAMHHLDYEAVIAIKQKVTGQLYDKEKHFFKDDFDWFEFFEINRHWLTPYAVFCYLRDKYKTADFAQWDEYAVYDEEKVFALAAKDTDHYDEIAVHYFTQYHLHLQLRDATDYAHRLGMVLKADLPIGVGRNSVDTWMYPHLFHMDMQAGAPPDAFATEGQNWSFPTYNWERMSKDDYAWWRQRMEQLSNYFDAVRIDHILGFFRIWSIPIHAVQGILGHFVPAKPVAMSEFQAAGLSFQEQRLCEPFITEEILYRELGDNTEWVKSEFLEQGRFKETFRTQRSLENYFAKHTEKSFLKEKLFRMLADVILLKDEEQGGYHFRINIFSTESYKHLPAGQQAILNRLYDYYFFSLQNEIWKKEGIVKIKALKFAANNMLLCGEDLGMVPEMVPEILHQLQILSLQVERMPKKSTTSFSTPASASYDSVITPSTHDMSTLREWWEEDRKITQAYYNHILGHYGEAPQYCEPEIANEIVKKHLHSPAMWTVFLLQDLLAGNASLRKENPKEERINIPADPNHYWNYRMHIPIETLMDAAVWNTELLQWITESNR